MSEAIIVAIITGSISLIGTVITVVATAFAQNRKRDIQQAVMDQKIDDLTIEVRKHNAFAERVPKLEAKVETMQSDINYLKDKLAG